MTVTVKIARYY